MSATPPAEVTAAEYKLQGTAAYQNGEYRKAIFLFSKSIELSAETKADPVLYSNRSACYCLIEDFNRALEDANVVINLRPEWSKGFTRKAAALRGLLKFDESAAAYSRALELEADNDVAQKGLAELTVAVRQQSKPFNHVLSTTTLTSLGTAKKQLKQMKDVVWHMEILKDRIWLADPPLTPFRPRSMFILDLERRQLLSMTAHPSRESITLDQLVEFVANAFHNSGIYPGTIEFSNFKLMSAIEPSFTDFNINFICHELSEFKRTFLDEKIEEFEAREREQWKDNPKFTGVLHQRLQKGLLSIPGVTPTLIQHLLASSAAFWRSRAMVYATKPMGLTVEGGATKVALVVRNALGQYSLAQSTVEAARNPQDTGLHSYLFADPSTISFDDADLIERFGWDIADNQYPSITLHQEDGATKLPSREDLEWYEMAFAVIPLFIEATFAKPVYEAPPALCARCSIHTSQGLQRVVVTVPPADPPGPPDLELEAPPPPPPKMNLAHVGATPRSGAKTPDAPTSTASTPTPTRPLARLASDNKLQQKYSRKPSSQRLSVKTTQSTTPKAPGKSHVGTSLPPVPSTPPPKRRLSLGSTPRKQRDELVTLRRQGKEQELAMERLRNNLKESNARVESLQRLGNEQKALIDRLQTHAQELTSMNDMLRHDIREVGAEAASVKKEHLLALVTYTHQLVQALAAVDPEGARDVVEGWGSASVTSQSFPVAFSTPGDMTGRSLQSSSDAAPQASHRSSSPFIANIPPSVSCPVQAVTPKHTLSPNSPLRRRHRTPPVQLLPPQPPIGPRSHTTPLRKAMEQSSPTKLGDKKHPPIPRAAFLKGPWVGRLTAVAVLPQDLTQLEYLSPQNNVF